MVVVTLIKKEYTGVKELFHFTTHMLQNKTN